MVFTLFQRTEANTPDSSIRAFQVALAGADQRIIKDGTTLFSLMNRRKNRFVSRRDGLFQISTSPISKVDRKKLRLIPDGPNEENCKPSKNVIFRLSQ